MATKCAVILAGGQSRRFGRDKTALIYNGRLLIAPLVEMLRDEGFDVTLLAPPKSHFTELRCRILPDHTPHEGPLPAIAGALARLDAERILVIAADMPFLTPEVARLLWQSAPSSALTYLEDEVLPAVYTKSALPTMTALVASGERRLHHAHAALRPQAHTIPATLWQVADPDCRSLININAPGDWENNGPDRV